MAKLVYALNQSLDGYVDHLGFKPSVELFRHFIDLVGSLTGLVYGRRMYETMRYWDEDQPDWTPAQREYAAAWRSRPKWVISRSLKAVGPNATLVANDAAAVIGKLKGELRGEIDIAGPDLARTAIEAGLIDEYRIYLHSVVVGRGKPFFAGPKPQLRLLSSELIAKEVIRLTYGPG
jgi:dihydrofolate reductase